MLGTTALFPSCLIQFDLLRWVKKEQSFELSTIDAKTKTMYIIYHEHPDLV
jgi:hypothetical protein